MLISDWFRRQSVSSGTGGFSTPSRSWIGKSISKKLRRSSTGKRTGENVPSYQKCSVAPSPPAAVSSSPSSPVYQCPPVFYNYRQADSMQFSDTETQFLTIKQERLKGKVFNKFSPTLF